jgi:diaminohydroxyphosphoribosylaminopyrimidine deaminase / 5-amino-6-(5-phosphoribosylamino)uracil reductase
MTPDELHMRRALDLALAGVGLVSPNPAVGAVVVDSSGNEAGTGTHTYDGVKHAEVLALEQAGARARGGSLFLNLEPCSHQGRTGPCADAILAAGIKRVVASIEDPNPRVAGAGFAKLRAAGIQVEVGLFEAEAKKLNESFAKYIRHGTPLVTLKSAMTLDGKIARSAAQHRDSYQGTLSGVPQSQPQEPAFRRCDGDTDADAREWITGEAARAHVQQLRHQHDAILVGVGTVIADDPLLTDRSGLPRRRRLLRVILDSHLRIPQTLRVVETAEDDVLVVYASAEEKARKALEAKGIRVAQIAGADGRPDFAAVLRRLGELEITSLLVEGGSRVNAAALASREVDKVFLYYAPMILGKRAVSFANGEGPGGMHHSLSLRRFELHRFGDDYAIEGYMKDVYQD